MSVNQLIQAIQIEYQKQDYPKALHFSRTLGGKLATMKNAEVPYGICLFYEGRILVDQNNLAEGEAPLIKCRKIYQDQGMTDYSFYLMASLALADLYFLQSKDEAATELYQLVEHSKEYGHDIGIKTKIYHKYAVFAERRRDYDAAIQGYEKYLAAFAQMHNDQAPTYREWYRYKEKLKLALAAKRSGFSKEYVNEMGLIQATFPNGDATMMDVRYAAYMVSDLPNPSNQDVAKLLDKTEVLIIDTQGQQTQIELTGPRKTTLKECLIIVEADAGHEMQVGEMALRFCAQDGTEIGRIDYIKKGLIRMEDTWKPDAILLNMGVALEAWVKEHR